MTYKYNTEWLNRFEYGLHMQKIYNCSYTVELCKPRETKLKFESSDARLFGARVLDIIGYKRISPPTE